MRTKQRNKSVPTTYANALRAIYEGPDPEESPIEQLEELKIDLTGQPSLLNRLIEFEEFAKGISKKELVACYVLQKFELKSCEHLLDALEESSVEEADKTFSMVKGFAQHLTKLKAPYKKGAEISNRKWEILRAEVKPHWDNWQDGKVIHKSQAAFARWAAREVCGDEVTSRKIEGWSKAWREEKRQSRKR